ncbi:hypothetical protein CR513_50552, partial [Mucuna pruriens]
MSYPTTSTNQKGKGRKKEKLLTRDKSPKKESAPFKGHRADVCKVKDHESNTHKSRSDTFVLSA